MEESVRYMLELIGADAARALLAAAVITFVLQGLKEIFPSMKGNLTLIVLAGLSLLGGIVSQYPEAGAITVVLVMRMLGAAVGIFLISAGAKSMAGYSARVAARASATVAANGDASTIENKRLGRTNP